MRRKEQHYNVQLGKGESERYAGFQYLEKQDSSAVIQAKKYQVTCLREADEKRKETQLCWFMYRVPL